MSFAIPGWVPGAQAASLYWDGSSTGANADGGPGTWSTAASPANWDTSAIAGSDVAWTNGSGAVFGGNPGAVVVSGTVSATSLDFNVPGYQLTGGNVTLTGTPAIQVAANDVGGNGATVGSVLAGSAAISKTGSGTLTLSGANTFAGSFTIATGIVKAASSTAFGGTANDTIISPGATLELNGQNLGMETLVISGSGVGGTGAIVNNGASAFNALQYVELAGPASVGGTTRWDIRGNSSASLSMAGHTLTKTGPNDFHLVNTNVSLPGSMDIQQGSAWVEGFSSLNGTAANVINIRSGTSLVQWNNNQNQPWTAAFENNGRWLAHYLISRWTGPVTLAGSTVFEVGGGGWGDDASMTTRGVISGPGSMTKTGPGTWNLDALNTYAGGTTVNSGNLVLTAASAGTGTLRGAVTVNAGGALSLAVANALGTTAGARVSPLNISGGLVDNTSAGSNAPAVINFTAGMLRSNGGVTRPDAASSYTMADDAVVNSLAAPTPSVISGRLHLGTGNTGNASGFNVAAGTATEGLRMDAAVTQQAGAGRGITKLGTGLMALNGPGLFTGATTVQAGTLVVTANGSLTGSPVTVNPGGRFGATLTGKSLTTLTAHAGSSLMLPAQAGGTTTVAGPLALADGNIGICPVIGADTPAGTYDLVAAGGITGTGTPVLNLAGAFGSTRATGTVAVNGNKLQLTLTGTGADLVWTNASASGSTTGVWDAALANFSNGAANDAFQAFDSVTFNDSVAPGSAKTITLGTILAPARLSVANSNGDYTFSSTGGLAGAGSLVKTGASRLTVGGPNRYTMSGNITAGGGILDFAGQSISAAGLTVAGGGEFNNAMATFGSMDLQSGIAGATLVSEGTWTKGTAGTVTLTANNSLSGSGTVAAGHLIVGNITTPNASGALGSGPVAISNGASVTLARGDASPVIPNGFSGSGGLNLLGNNTGNTGTSGFQLTGDNSAFSGPLSVSNARISVSTGKEIGSGPISLTGRGAIYASQVTLPNAISASASGSWSDGGSASGNLILENAGLTGPLILAGGTTTSVRGIMWPNQPSHNFISGPITESGGSASLSFNTTGNSAITLSGASTYTGSTFISGSGVVKLNGSLGPTAVSVSTFATLGGNGVIGNGGSLTFGNRAVLKANLSGGALTVNGNVNLGSSTYVAVEVTQDPVMNGPIPVLNYTGTLTGTAANLSMDYLPNYRQAVFAFTPGLITVDIGTKALIWKGTSSSMWQVGVTTKCWNTTGSGETDYFFKGDSVTFDDTGSGYVISPYTLEPSAVLVNNPTKDYTISAGMTGPCALTKNGNGGLYLVSFGSYTGGTTVNAGRLEVTLSPLGTGPVTIATGATLAGDATITGPVAIAGTLDPGLSGQSWPSTLSTGPASLSGTYACQLDSNNSDRLSVTGDLNLTGATLALTKTFSSSGPATFTIASYTGTLAGSFSSVSGMPSGYVLRYQAAEKRIVIIRMTSFADWTASFPGLADASAGGDPDGDDVPNLLEYVLAGNPGASDPAILPTQTVDAVNLVFRFQRSDVSKSNTTQIVQWSSDLSSWTDIPVPASSSGPVGVVGNGDAPDDIAVTIPRVAGAMFARLKVVQP